MAVKLQVYAMHLSRPASLSFVDLCSPFHMCRFSSAFKRSDFSRDQHFSSAFKRTASAVLQTTNIFQVVESQRCSKVMPSAAQDCRKDFSRIHVFKDPVFKCIPSSDHHFSSRWGRKEMFRRSCCRPHKMVAKTFQGSTFPSTQIQV